MAWVGATFGLLVATKVSALPMGLVIIVLVLFVPTWKRRVSLLAVAGGGAFLTCGWYLIQNTAALRRSLGQDGGFAFSPPTPASERSTVSPTG